MAQLTIQYAQSLLNDAEQLAYSNPHQLVIKQYDQNAKLLANNVESLNGRGAIETYFVDRNAKDPKGEYRMTLHVDSTTTNGDVGFVEGTFEVTKQSGGSIINNGKFMVVLKQVSGNWIIFRYMYNSNK